jgi:hypothetical protein
MASDEINWADGRLPVRLDPTENPRHFGAGDFPREM